MRSIRADGKVQKHTPPGVYHPNRQPKRAELGDYPPMPRNYIDHFVSKTYISARIAAGIRQYCNDLNTELAYHEPTRDTTLLQRFHDDADSIARYILEG